MNHNHRRVTKLHTWSTTCGVCVSVIYNYRVVCFAIHKDIITGDGPTVAVGSDGFRIQ